MHHTNILAVSFLALMGCPSTPVAGDTADTGALPAGPVVAPATPQTLQAGQLTTYTITNLDDAQAYRITLVVNPNITPIGDGTGLFLDADGDGAADAGLSEGIALITTVNGADVTDAKTVPAGTDNPAAPTGVFPVAGQITVEVLGVSSGTVHPVAYVNGGLSTFLEIDAATGRASELHGLGGALTVTGEAVPSLAVSPADEQTVSVGDTETYTVTGLDDAQAYRVTLVLAENLTLTGTGTATFIDEDANGAADSGLSEAIANIVSVNGEDVTGTKTVPSGEDDPAAPTGVFPVGGQITLDVTGLAPGKVHPVAYENGGTSTFLELGTGGGPVEAYFVGGAFTVQ